MDEKACKVCGYRCKKYEKQNDKPENKCFFCYLCKTHCLLRRTKALNTKLFARARAYRGPIVLLCFLFGFLLNAKLRHVDIACFINVPSPLIILCFYVGTMASVGFRATKRAFCGYDYAAAKIFICATLSAGAIGVLTQAAFIIMNIHDIEMRTAMMGGIVLQCIYVAFMVGYLIVVNGSAHRENDSSSVV